MADKPLIATHMLAIFSMIGGGIVQVGIILMLGVALTPRYVIGSIIVACFIGGGAAVLLQEYVHVNSFVAGVLGTGTGLFPAVLSTSLITRKALERAGVNPSQLKEMRQIIQEDASRKAEEVESK